jgi:hypothetical protein
MTNADDDIIQIFSPMMSHTTVARCGNHPAVDGVNTCDSCNRYLCAECLRAPIELNSRVYYFCKDEACQKEYQRSLRPRILKVLTLLWGLVFPLVTLLIYVSLNLFDFRAEFGGKYLGKSIVWSAVLTGSINATLRGRRKTG